MSDYYYGEDLFFNSQIFNGKIINNKYLLIMLLGTGSFCGVFLTFNLETKNLICVKLYEEYN